MDEFVKQIREAYDQTLYHSLGFPNTHPRNLSRIALLKGLHPALSTHCRILEIGCATGANVLPMAQILPHSSILALDLSPRNIEIAKDASNRLKLQNIEFRCQDIMDFEFAEGSFDYIVAHGFYSWVPSQVRDRLMKIMACGLAEQGVGYISYNTLPGWHLKRVARDLMLFHSRNSVSPEDRLAKGFEVLSLAAKNLSPGDPYRDVLRGAAARGPVQPNILHDEMGVINDPVYFEEFVRHIERFQLRYLGHADVGSGMRSLSPSLREQLREISSDEIVQEQYADFLGGRCFGASIVCRESAVRSSKQNLDLVPDMYVAGWLREDKHLSAGSVSGPWTFIAGKNNQQFSIHDASVCAVIRKINEAWPASVPVRDLIVMCGENLKYIDSRVQNTTSPFTGILCDALYSMFEVDLVELHTEPIDFIGKATGPLYATRLARLQAARGESITNLRHEQLPKNEVINRLLPLLDGTRGRSALFREFSEMVAKKEIGVNSMSFNSVEADLKNAFEQLLDFLSNHSLLYVDPNRPKKHDQ